MRVRRRQNPPFTGIPDYYNLHCKWANHAEKTGDNYALQESYRFARLAEEFGQAIIDDDDTVEH